MAKWPWLEQPNDKNHNNYDKQDQSLLKNILEPLTEKEEEKFRQWCMDGISRPVETDDL